jgi:hypothetical protein
MHSTMTRVTRAAGRWSALVCLASIGAAGGACAAAQQTPVPGTRPQFPASRTVTQADCSAARLGTSIPVSAVGEPVSGVTLSEPTWVEATETVPAHCRIDGSLAPVDPSPTARPILFRVLLPAVWTHRSAQLGGSGFNGVIPNLVANAGMIEGPTPLQRGFAVYGSDSGHQAGPGMPVDWALNDERIRNLGYMQMKKTPDAAMVLIVRMYGERPRFNYYLGTSQGGREALTVAQRYPEDYDGIISNVPIVSFSSLMLAPALIRIQEKPLANWVTPAKVNAIRTEFMRQCDGLDALIDGIINNYIACRAIFDVRSPPAGRDPWRAKRCPNGVDPAPADTTASACLTSGQISTLHFVYSRYPFATALAHGNTAFGMWVPGTEPGGAGLIVGTRFRGQEGAAPDAPMFTHLGVLGITGFLMGDLNANPLDYVEGGPLNPRREQLSRWLDSTDPDLSRFQQRGGKMIVTIGTNDPLASPGAQLDYYQAVLDRMGRPAVDAFARFYVLPQTGHGLSGTSYVVDGEGRPNTPFPIPNSIDRLGLLLNWVENGVAPGITETVTAGERTLPLCSYPAYPRYASGPPTAAGSYVCAAN